MNFQQKLDAAVNQNSSLLCVGLDPDLSKIPVHLEKEKNPIFSFNKEIIDATHHLVCSYKPNSAFYEAYGENGIFQLKMTFDYLKEKYPEIPVILDAKRADIGSTNKGYVQFAFEYLNADAITLHPYLGKEALKPFLDNADKGCFILCKTSNPGAGEFQNLKAGGKPLYKVVAEKVATDWNKNQNCMLVVGATYPKELLEVRKIIGDITILVPGVGAQGGDIESTLKNGLNSKKRGLIISSSRGIIYASSGKNFAEKAREEVVKLNEGINGEGQKNS
jgi:orotidine-5'-phosphate decarboxylase